MMMMMKTVMVFDTLLVDGWSRHLQWRWWYSMMFLRCLMIYECVCVCVFISVIELERVLLCVCVHLEIALTVQCSREGGVVERVWLTVGSTVWLHAVYTVLGLVWWQFSSQYVGCDVRLRRTEKNGIKQGDFKL